MSGCGKSHYASRHEAKREVVRSRRHYRSDRMSQYFCGGCQAWHIGRLGSEVIAGVKSRGEAYGRAAA